MDAIKTTSYVPLTPSKVSEVIDRVRPAILEYRKLNDERKIQDVTRFLSKKRTHWFFFKRTPHVTREDAIRFLRKGSWLDATYFGVYPSQNFDDEMRLCNDLETGVRAIGFAPNEHLVVSVENLAAIEHAYNEFVKMAKQSESVENG